MAIYGGVSPKMTPLHLADFASPLRAMQLPAGKNSETRFGLDQVFW